MTHPLREAVARAMFEADEARLSPAFRHQWDNILSQRQEEYRYRAGAATAATLAGIRKPSWKAEQLGHYAIGEAIARNGGMNTMSDAGDCWRAMIDALAKEVAGDADQR